ncbi:hypothetical protein Rsub_00786 [Raphidocelis subcapitata]|uniref:O-acyltransferase WSD1 C-terminal domain-containing protein n=1 Tax=Raphidocelis subcapitata TaxID=307507 RepID=A0A2V0NL14_9CHLO|nr:hypothetical protein Rsub_00786 [Raphidocelis subcapitata]|eukprot:GBF88074.1 hypothetical protein Rsub_00786 [Raphidocelis subcapitata]
MSAAGAAVPPGLGRLRVQVPDAPTDGGAALGPTADCPPLSPVSQIFMGMGEATPDIYAIIRLRGNATVDEMAVCMRRLVDAHDRFRMRPTRRGGIWCNQLVEDFDIYSCMKEVTLEGKNIDAAFNGYVSQLMSGPPLSEEARPPWDCSVVHFASDPGHTDVLLRCSHIIGDGQLFMQLLKDVMEEYEEVEIDEILGGSASDDAGSVASDGGASEAGCSSGGGASSAGSARSSFSGGQRGPSSPLLIRAVRHSTAFLPPPSVERAERERRKQLERQERARTNGGGRRGLARVVAIARRQLAMLWGWITSALFVLTFPLRRADPVNVVKASPEEMRGPRRFASITLPLDELRHVSKLLRVTINTLAVSCLAGGLRRHLLRQPGAAEGRGGAGVPDSLLLCALVDTRAMRRAKAEAAAAKGAAAPLSGGCNTLSFMGVPLHTGPAHPLVRLASVGAALEWVRGSLCVLFAILMPPVIQFFVRDAGAASRLMIALLPAKTTVGFSNMRGPVKRVMLGGYPVEKMYNGVQPSAFGCFLSLMSYDNQVTLVNSCYATKSTRPQDLLDCIREEWRALKAAATAPASGSDGGAAALKAKAKAV